DRVVESMALPAAVESLGEFSKYQTAICVSMTRSPIMEIRVGPQCPSYILATSHFEPHADLLRSGRFVHRPIFLEANGGRFWEPLCFRGIRQNPTLPAGGSPAMP